MTIYGIKIDMPHSGDLSRSQVMTILKKEVNGGEKWRERLEGLKQFGYNILCLEDTNGKIKGKLFAC